MKFNEVFSSGLFLELDTLKMKDDQVLEKLSVAYSANLISKSGDLCYDLSPDRQLDGYLCARQIKPENAKVEKKI